VYRPGAEAIVPDALSRRDQDTLGKEDHDSRFRQLIPEECLQEWPRAAPFSAEEEEDTPTTQLTTREGPLQDQELNAIWKDLKTRDRTYQTVFRAVRSGERNIPPEVRLKIQLSDCHIDAQENLRHRGKLWVPGAPFTMEDERKQAGDEDKGMDSLRTKILQKCHDSPISGHPGREGTAFITGRDYYWPLMSYHIRRFCRNCDSCGRNRVWRDHKNGLLQPLPVPDRFFQEISMDFMVDLPESGGCRHLWVIKDRLSKAVVLEPMPTMKAEDCAQKFMECWARFHGFPRAITSDRGTNWTSTFWRRLCKLLGVHQRLSSAYHPQTDGGPERLNQDIQVYLRNYINHAQSDWKQWLPTAQLAINGRKHSAIGISPFFALHGYEAPAPSPLDEDPVDWVPLSAEKRAAEFVDKMKRVTEICQASMAASNQQQEESANKRRRPAPIFRKGDKVWLSLRNYTTDRPKKKLDIRQAKYTVAEVISPLSVRLEGIPKGIHPVFHPDLLKLASNDPLVDQVTDDSQPDPILFEGHDEFTVEKILCARNKKRGKGREVLVKWHGYRETNWEPLENLDDVEALDEFERQYGTAKENDGPRLKYTGDRKKKKVAKEKEIIHKAH
jgi:transposase InsO family protein